MQDASTAASIIENTQPQTTTDGKQTDVVSTHVLVPEEQVNRLKELSRKTRIAQSEYLREAVDDLLDKYGRGTRQS